MPSHVSNWLGNLFFSWNLWWTLCARTFSQGKIVQLDKSLWGFQFPVVQAHPLRLSLSGICTFAARRGHSVALKRQRSHQVSKLGTELLDSWLHTSRSPELLRYRTLHAMIIIIIISSSTWTHSAASSNQTCHFNSPQQPSWIVFFKLTHWWCKQSFSWCKYYSC